MQGTKRVGGGGSPLWVLDLMRFIHPPRALEGGMFGMTPKKACASLVFVVCHHSDLVQVYEGPA